MPSDLVSATSSFVSRRSLLAGIGASGALALSGCTSLGGLGGFSLTDAIRRVLLLSSERAFARLTGDGGFWDQQVARIGFDDLLGARGNVLAGILTSNVVKQRLEDSFADIAIDASARAAPVVTDVVRTIGIDNAVALVRGGPTASAATQFLREEMGDTLIDVLAPDIGSALRLARDPIVGQALAALTGVDIPRVERTFSEAVNDAIFQEIAREERAIRANPSATNDPVIIGVLGANAAL